MSDELGVGALLVPETFGGLGLTLLEAGRVAEALAGELAGVPFLSTGVLAPTLLTGLAADDPRSAAGRLLGRLAEGAVVAVAWADATPGEPISHPIASNSSSATASFRYVIDGDAADVIVLVGAGGEQIVSASADGLRVTPRITFDLTRGLADVVADDTAVVPLGSGPAARQAFARMMAVGWLLLAAESAGGARAAVDLAVAYARQRIQFGREIGSFQAVKHLLADAHLDAELALSMARLAIEADVTGAAEAAELAAASAFYCADRYVSAAGTGIQVHGGIGFTVECRAHLYRRRAESNRQLLGRPDRLRADYLALLAQEEKQS